ncbi:uncharacterized protein BDV14DRAFT_196956 [Aspergillus stella-maris]|uniref:uncharacterized protein n=1 Tax=Aspergillus stella-maris TaxID=1810926 RepID=UPI003CCD8786
MESFWGDAETKVDFAGELKTRLEVDSYSPAVVHLDLDVLDDSGGKINDYPSPGGLFEEELVSCMEIVARMIIPRSLTVCALGPGVGDRDKTADIAIRAIVTFVKGILSKGVSKSGWLLSILGYWKSPRMGMGDNLETLRTGPQKNASSRKRYLFVGSLYRKPVAFTPSMLRQIEGAPARKQVRTPTRILNTAA